MDAPWIFFKFFPRSGLSGSIEKSWFRRIMIQRMLEAVSCAPSGGNAQPWAFVVVLDPETRKDVTGLVELKSLEGSLL